MGTYKVALGSPGVTHRNKVTALGIKLTPNEYPTKIHFELFGGGPYWKNSAYATTTGEFWLYGDASGKLGVKFGELTLPKISSNIKLKDFDIPNGISLLGCELFFTPVTSNKSGVGLRNRCQITVTTAIGSIEPEKPNNPDLYKKLLPTVGKDDKMVGMARRSDWKINVKGVDITDTIKKDLISLELTDNEESMADDLQLKMSDRDGEWLQKFLNDTIRKGAKTKGLTFTAWIGSTDHTGKVLQQKTGSYSLDTISHDGPPAVVKIKCVSLDFQGGIRTDKNDKCWENVKLSQIASDIAAKGKLKLIYCSDKNPKYTRKEQDSETDISFLIRLCDAAGLSVKVSDGQLIIFDRKTFESGTAVEVITYGDGSYIKWSLGTGNGNVTYDICTVRYTDPVTGKKVEGQYKSPAWTEEENRVKEANKDKKKDADKEQPEHSELVIKNIKVETKAEANDLAETELGLANLFERNVSFTLPGNPSVMSGLPVVLKNFGYWAGKYMITSCTHSITKDGYTTKIKLRYIGKA